MNAYRPEPVVGQTSAPLIWRPWMTRLATVVGVAASPALCIYGIVRDCEAFPGSSAPGWAYAVLVILVLQVAVSFGANGMAIIHAAFDFDRKLAPSRMLLASWGVLVYPCIGIARLAKWVAYGDA